MLKVLRGLRDQLGEAPATIAVGSRLARQTGLMWSLSRPGLIALGRIFGSGSQNPSLVYRLHGKNTPDKPALIARGETMTWEELDAQIDRLATGLLARGIGRGESMVLMMKNRAECVQLGAATARAGAAAVTVSWRSTAEELAYLVNHSGSHAIAIEAELLPVLEAARGELSQEFLRNVFVLGSTSSTVSSTIKTIPFEALLDHAQLGALGSAILDDDASVVVYTSGTTGKPKGAVRKFPRDAMRAAMRFINETPMRSEDVHLVTCPLYHSTAFAFLGLSHLVGCTAVIMETFEPEAFLAAIERHRVTTTAVVPTMLQRVLDLPAAVRARYDTRSLRIVFSGGAPLPGPLATAFMDAFGDVVFNFYGATETGLVTLARPEDLRAAPGTIGRLVPGNEVRLLDDDKKEVDSDSVGELYVRSKMLVAGYHNDAQATRSSMADGFFSVGDLARRDRHGRYFIEGRKRDMVISGGVNVYPAEVEAALELHPAVEEVAVVGIPDREWGERVRAYVVPRQGATVDEDSLRTFARARLAGPKIPRDIVFLDALPRNPTGKVLKRELRERP